MLSIRDKNNDTLFKVKESAYREFCSIDGASISHISINLIAEASLKRIRKDGITLSKTSNGKTITLKLSCNFNQSSDANSILKSSDDIHNAYQMTARDSIVHFDLTNLKEEVILKLLQTIELTAREVQALLICIFSRAIQSEEKVNKSGSTTPEINRGSASSGLPPMPKRPSKEVVKLSISTSHNQIADSNHPQSARDSSLTPPIQTDNDTKADDRRSSLPMKKPTIFQPASRHSNGSSPQINSPTNGSPVLRSTGGAVTPPFFLRNSSKEGSPQLTSTRIGTPLIIDGVIIPPPPLPSLPRPNQQNSTATSSSPQRTSLSLQSSINSNPPTSQPSHSSEDNKSSVHTRKL